MPPIRNNRRAGATNTRASGPVGPARRTVPTRAPAPTPIVEATTRTPVEEVDMLNEGALQALKPEDDLDQVPASFFCVKFKLLKLMHSSRDLE